MLFPWLVLLGRCFLCMGGWFSNSNWNLGQNRGIANTSLTNCNDAEGEVDLLQALNVSTALRGVGQSHGPRPLDELPAWKLHATFDHVQLPPGPTAHLLHAVQKSHNFVMNFAFRQHRKTIATLLAVNSPGKLSPWLRLTSNLKQGHLMLFYRIKEDTRLHEKIFPLPRHTNWTLLELTVHGDVVTLSLECQKARKQRLAGHINLHFPKDSLVYFRQEPGFKKKLLGTVQVARVGACPPQERLWQCGNSTLPTSTNLD